MSLKSLFSCLILIIIGFSILLNESCETNNEDENLTFETDTFEIVSSQLCESEGSMWISIKFNYFLFEEIDRAAPNYEELVGVYEPALFFRYDIRDTISGLYESVTKYALVNPKIKKYTKDEISFKIFYHTEFTESTVIEAIGINYYRIINSQRCRFYVFEKYYCLDAEYEPCYEYLSGSVCFDIK